MLLARTAPPLSAAGFPANTERALRPRGQASSRAAVARASAAAKAASFPVRQKRKQVASVVNPLVKHCVKLRLSASYRRSCRRLLLVGLAPILEMCRFEFAVVEYLFLLDGVEVPEELHEFSGNVMHVSAAVMKKVSGMQSVDSTEAIAVMHMPKHFRVLGSGERGAVLDGLFHSPKRILVLDGIQDPGNLGTLIRSACAFNWDGVFLLPPCCDPFNEKALRAARGASLQLPIVSGTWHDLHSLMAKYDMKIMAGHPESSTDGSKLTHTMSKELADSLVNEPLCLVLGSEGNGLSSETLQACELVNIPMEAELLKDGVFLLPPCCDPFNEKALRAARGASLQLPIVSGTWHDLHSLMAKYDMKIMAGHPESSTDGSKLTHTMSKELADSLVNEPLCLVLGSEGNGLSSETLQACELVNIPMEGTFESLNVSVAGGIFLFMLQQQHQINSRTS